MKRLIACLILLSGPALAQQQQSSAIDRLSIGLGQCVGQSEQRADQIAELQKQLAAAQARVKELEPKSDISKSQ